MKKVLFALILFLFLVPRGYAADVKSTADDDCSGENQTTHADVTGSCDEGTFIGEDQDNGNSVSGKCDENGNFTATDDETGEAVSGTCEES